MPPCLLWASFSFLAFSLPCQNLNASKLAQLSPQRMVTVLFSPAWSTDKKCPKSLATASYYLPLHERLHEEFIHTPPDMNAV